MRSWAKCGFTLYIWDQEAPGCSGRGGLAGARGYQPGKIGALGYSLGAASAIGAASEEQDTGAIWTDSADADVKSVIERSWKKSGLPMAFLYSDAVIFSFSLFWPKPHVP